MSPASPQRARFIRNWLEHWSWTKIAIIAFPSLLMVLVLLGTNHPEWIWLAGIFAMTVFIALQINVFRHGGWRLLGPHFYYDVVRLARRGQTTLLRCAYILALFAGLALVFAQAPARRDWRPNDFAAVSERFAFTLFFIQNLAVVILTPAYLASAITEEKERRTLELLFTTQLNSAEIILGKLFSRIIHLFGFVIAGFPILSLIQFWGGIDMLLIAGNLANTLLNVVTIGSVCLLISAMSRTVSGAVMASYALIVPVSLFCARGHSVPFVLQDPRQAGNQFVSVEDLGILAIVHFALTATCLALAAAALREHPLRDFGPITPPPRTPGPSDQESPQTKPTKPRVSPGIFSLRPLPPVTDNALLWKERYLGGPLPFFTLPFFSLIIRAPALPLFMAGILALGSWFLVALCFDIRGFDDYRRDIESFGRGLRFFYYVLLACYVLGVAYRATGSVARERQQQTLEPLLLLPIDRREILRAKWLGSLMRDWPWLALILADIVLGTLIGAYHPFTAVLWCLAPWPMIFFFASVGLFLSVVMTTVLRANLMMVLVAVLFITCANTRGFAYGPFAYLETFAFSLRGDSMQDGKERLILAAGATFLYLLAAAGLWMLTVLLFEKRARQSEI
jgi:ABC-type transport system involved in multi-copper enzyme maturation permease subunit